MSTATDTTNPPGHDPGEGGSAGPRLKPTVVVASFVFTAVVALWALIAPERSAEILGGWVGVVLFLVQAKVGDVVYAR